MPGSELPGPSSFLNLVLILQLYGVEAAESRHPHHSFDIHHCLDSCPDLCHGSQNCPFGRPFAFLYPYLGWVDPEIALGVAPGVGPEPGLASLRIWGLAPALLKPFL